MIILLHGTGDDDSKAENWMPWVTRIMEKYGQHVLSVPGVASSEQGKVATNALAFLEKTTRLWGKNQVRAIAGTQIDQLCAALNEAGGDEIMWAAKVAHGNEEKVIKSLGDFHETRGREDGAFTYGIKYRTAVAGICALAYYRRTPAANLQPFRIVGHSRGGATAVALHNVLTYYGIPCNHTLTLDPCHGVKKAQIAGMAAGTIVPILGNVIGYKLGKAFGSQKDYYHKVWGGRLKNIPCKKNVGDTVFNVTYRPLIEPGTGGNAEIENLARVNQIKHGHMGKFGSLSGDKDRARASLAVNLNVLMSRNLGDARTHLTDLFRRFNVTGPDATDRVFITNSVVTTLTS